VPDSYIGQIVVESSEVKNSVNVVIDVKAKSPLFDVTVDVKEETISPGEDVTALIEIFNLGDLSNIDVLLYYDLRDFDGNVITFGEESLAIERRIAVIRNLHVPEYLADGTYVVYVRAKYGDIQATGSKAIRVSEFALAPLFERGSTSYYIFIILIILGIIGIIAVIISLIIIWRKRRRVRKAIEFERKRREQIEREKRKREVYVGS